MTIIAYRDGILAADSRVWQDRVLASVANRKVFRLDDGRLFAAFGRSCDAAACLEWISGGMERRDRPDNAERDYFGAFLIDDPALPPLKIEWDFRPFRAPSADFWVFGAHVELLIGAMGAGASAKEAVEIAIKFGDSAAGEVQWERFGDG